MKEGTTIYFIRHGRTYLNEYRYMQGWSNAPLTPEGKQTVHASGRGLSLVKFDAIYTSDLSRTQDTASIILQENQVTSKDMPMIAMPEFREVFFGSFEGQPEAETFDKVGRSVSYSSGQEFRLKMNSAQRMNAFHEADPYHDAENFKQFWSRVEQGLIKIIARHREKEETILLVAHGAAIHYIVENIIPGFSETSSLQNASVTKVRYNQGQFHLDYYGKTDHFLLEDGEKF